MSLMNKQVAFWCSPPYLNDNFFLDHGPLNRDDTLAPTRKLRNMFADCGIECHTQDVYQRRRLVPEAVIFFDHPKKPIQKVMKAWYGKTTPYLVICECEVINPHNWNLNFHNSFKKIFTWSKRYVDNQQYFWMKDSPCKIYPINRDLRRRHKNLVMIFSNKHADHSLELYSARRRVIKWFEQHPDIAFDFYGGGWDRRRFRFKPLRVLHKFPFLVKLLAPKYRNYKGTVPGKYDVYCQYNFAICFENARDIPDYFTEKIFDCMHAGCIPIYWGAPNITDYIPESCFIDFNTFKSMESLYQYLTQMSDETYLAYRKAIIEFLDSKAMDQFSLEDFANTIANVVIADFQHEENKIEA